MTIYQSKAGQKHHLWAKFDFGVVTGVFRFMEPKALVMTKARKDSGSRIKSEHDTEDQEFESGPGFDRVHKDQDKRSRSAPVPYSSFRIASLPYASRPVVPFRWRGEETGEGEIQLDSDKYLCSMTFSGSGGVKCNGTFSCDYAGPSEFSGLKIGDLRSSARKKPQKEWKERSQGAHKRAESSRWGGWHYAEASDDEEEDD